MPLQLRTTLEEGRERWFSRKDVALRDAERVAMARGGRLTTMRDHCAVRGLPLVALRSPALPPRPLPKAAPLIGTNALITPSHTQKNRSTLALYGQKRERDRHAELAWRVDQKIATPETAPRAYTLKSECIRAL